MSLFETSLVWTVARESRGCPRKSTIPRADFFKIIFSKEFSKTLSTKSVELRTISFRLRSKLFEQQAWTFFILPFLVTDSTFLGNRFFLPWTYNFLKNNVYKTIFRSFLGTRNLFFSEWSSRYWNKIGGFTFTACDESAVFREVCSKQRKFIFWTNKGDHEDIVQLYDDFDSSAGKTHQSLKLRSFTDRI